MVLAHFTPLTSVKDKTGQFALINFKKQLQRLIIGKNILFLLSEDHDEVVRVCTTCSSMVGIRLVG